MCTLSFTFEGNCGTNLKALLECMNRQYFFPFYTKIKKKKVKFQNLIFFCSWYMVRWFSLVLLWKIENNNNYWMTQLWLCPHQHPIDSRPRGNSLVENIIWKIQVTTIGPTKKSLIQDFKRLLGIWEISVTFAQNLEKGSTTATLSSSWKLQEPEIITIDQALAAALESPAKPWT